ncbi:1,6-anhydro-N-acetylmuramyl-L-alanine amidase AmpD [Salinisphaera sp. T31B1]|uniref:1,6-anhydro-N-acetylmuramyl-L-alanine amidase AmpD n=1 Tax=Salinisphaera sp. T31B1 TaxID=727963 RepID=UPI003341E920
MTSFSIIDGWLTGIRRVASPNHDLRPHDSPIDALVIHGITLPPGRFGLGQVDALFTNALDVRAHAFYETIRSLRVSAHALIERTGAITQYVAFDDRAWHAGVSRLGTREAVNDFSIGIELEGTDHCPYTPAQYRTLAGVSAALLHSYRGLGRERIVGHSDIAPGRKTDPGPAFDWACFWRLLERACS